MSESNNGNLREVQGRKGRQDKRNRRLAKAAVEAYQRAKRCCGRYHPENNQECIYPIYQRTCIHCPMEWVAEIEDALKELGEE